jgi:serine dehydrogenase proteinase
VDRVIRLWKETVGRGKDSVNPYQELYKYLHPLVIGALDRASSLSLMLCREILGYHMRDTRKADRIARRLNSSYPAHQYPITSREARQLGLNVRDVDPATDELLQELNLLYSEMGQRAITDYDEANHHDNEITNILEGKALQVFYQVEKDWHYRKEERRWVPMNDVSSWYRCRLKEGRVVKTRFHIR